MSHAATNWAIKQRGLKPAAKLVLWNLADRHNADSGRCDPSQARLAEDCEMSRSTLNVHLRVLEEAGLIRRVQRSDPKTRRQERTFYLLAFDHDFGAGAGDAPPQHLEPRAQNVVVPCPKTGHGAVSENRRKPCPKTGESRVRNPDTNPVIEPGKEPYGRAALRSAQSAQRGKSTAGVWERAFHEALDGLDAATARAVPTASARGRGDAARDQGRAGGEPSARAAR